MRVVLVALLLAGCATTQPRIERVEIKVPVAVRCVEPGDLKPLPPKPPLPDNATAALAVAVGWLADLWPWAVEADGRLRACAGS
jgi:hypothetical protein